MFGRGRFGWAKPPNPTGLLHGLVETRDRGAKPEGALMAVALPAPPGPNVITSL